ncbi:MAG: hypothetical protein JKY40_10510 [Gammaproteobacteria bacterium]|nr:hypothetical protein [Gammaproteobacteria bacterium]MBL4729717.1 hypothetical protein [Gammaproteobacteria bacterium]
MQYPKSILFALILVLSSNDYSAENYGALNDDEASACGALLCLAGGTSLSECAKPLREFFSITDPNPARMIRKRLNFLRLCPTGDNGSLANILNNQSISCSSSQCAADVVKTGTFGYCLTFQNSNCQNFVILDEEIGTRDNRRIYGHCLTSPVAGKCPRFERL